jgi:hypothetical protein
MNARLAIRIAEIRACANVAELCIVAVDECENRAVVLLVPRACSGASTDSGWEQPGQPVMMLIDAAVLLGGHALH